jgi:type I restriction enzyme M protein
MMKSESRFWGDKIREFRELSQNYIGRSSCSYLKGVLPKVYARANLDKQSLSGLIVLIGTAKAQRQDVLGQFALAEGRKGGQFYTPESIVKLFVEMLEPKEQLAKIGFEI